MIPIAGQEFPKSAGELQAAIRTALTAFCILPDGGEVVRIDGGVYPALKAVAMTLDGASIRELDAPPKSLAVGPRQRGITIERFDLSAQPIVYQQSKLNVKVTGDGLAFDFGRDANHRPLLVLTAAARGTAELSVDADDAESLLFAAAKPAANEQGIAIQDLHLHLSSDGPRSLNATVRIKAKKMMMSGVVVVTGRVDISDALAATFSSLSCTGEGIVGSAAAAFVQKKIQPYDGVQIPLTMPVLGDVALRDIQIAVGDTINLTAAFGTR